MKTNSQRQAPLVNLRSRVLAVMDDLVGVRAAIRELSEAGIPGEDRRYPER